MKYDRVGRCVAILILGRSLNRKIRYHIQLRDLTLVLSYLKVDLLTIRQNVIVPGKLSSKDKKNRITKRGIMAELQNRGGKPFDKQKSFVSVFMQKGGQNAALQWLLDTKTPVCIFLITGVKFEGVVCGFDQYTIGIVDVKGHQQLVYKDKISTLTLKKSGPQVSVVHNRGPRHDNNQSETPASNQAE